MFRYVITSNGAMVTDVKEKKTLFRALIKKKMRFRSFPTAEKKNSALRRMIRHRYFAQGKLFYFGRPHCLRERCSGGLLREKHGRDSFKK